MRNKWIFGLVIVFTATTCTAQLFEGTHLDPFTMAYPSPPYIYDDSRFVLVTFTTTEDVVDALVPGPLDHGLGTQISVAVVEHHIVSPLIHDYHEAILLIPVTHEGLDGNFYPIMYLDNAISIISGREIFGVSKVDAEIIMDWSPDGNSVTVTVTRLDEDLITINADFGPMDSTPPAEGLTRDYNLKLIPSVEAGADPEVCQLTRLQGTSSTSGWRNGTGTLEFGHLPSDPLADIPNHGLNSVATFYLDSILQFGQVVWDYLAQPGGCAPVLSSPFIRNDSFRSFDASD